MINKLLKLSQKFWNMAMFGLVTMLLFGVYGLYKLYDYTFNDTIIESKTKVTPHLVITTKDSINDTLYVYTFKNE